MDPSSDTPKSQLDAREKPPEELRDLFKNLKGRFNDATAKENGVVDLDCGEVPIVGRIPQHILVDILARFQGLHDEKLEADMQVHGKVHSFNELPGLLILPSLLPPPSQKQLLSHLLHRDLCNPEHKTNLHFHHDLKYPANHASFFSEDPNKVSFQPINAAMHKPITIKSALEKKLRWVTLGGQYDWTNKVYPAEAPPEFPADIADLVRSLFPEMDPQAAIVNFYSPGDTLSLHRDVSEEVDRGLVSVSLGCDAIFIIGLHDEVAGTRSLVLRLRSGDVVYMGGESRYAWHAVPCILKGTCPDYLQNWPGDEFPIWQNWMQNKRINLNVRQMRERSPESVRPRYEFV